MFIESSRYYRTPERQVPVRGGKVATVVALRRTPVPTGDLVVVKANDQLDRMAHARYDDGTRYWHIADANTELQARQLTSDAGRAIIIPER